MVPTRQSYLGFPVVGRRVLRYRSSTELFEVLFLIIVQELYDSRDHSLRETLQATVGTIHNPWGY